MGASLVILGVPSLLIVVRRNCGWKIYLRCGLHLLEADPSLSIILQLLLFDWPANLFNLLLFLAETVHCADYYKLLCLVSPSTVL